VHAVEKGERQEGLAPERLEAAARVAGSVTQDRAAYGVGDARLHPFESGVAAAATLARHPPPAAPCRPPRQSVPPPLCRTLPHDLFDGPTAVPPSVAEASPRYRRSNRR